MATGIDPAVDGDAAEGGADARQWPRWLEEIDLTLSICPQFILYGNIHDNYLVPINRMIVPAAIVDALWARLNRRGYEFLLLYDPSVGLSVHPASARATAEAALRSQGSLNLSFPADNREPRDLRPTDLPALIRAVYRSGACGLVVQNASRLIASEDLSPPMLELFAACAQNAQSALPRPTRPPQKQPLFNPVFWLVDTMHDLPSWLVVGGERSRAVSVAPPDVEDRHKCAVQLASSLSGDPDPTARKTAIERFALRAEGLTLREMAAVAHIARDQNVAIEDIADAIRYYKVGVTEDPWNKPLLRTRIASGEREIGRTVKGQNAAIRQTLDILIRSVMGLHGAQASSSTNRPRGVLFFAGPTGVGKTELAKAVSRLVFGNEDACLRFDMSEFSAEQSEARLIGAPPGYVGHGAGGELVNAVRQQPFCVLLFDEIEKAHPRILDKFLQILEDGRLTDGRGDTVYFSEAVLIFTSNLGIVRRLPGGGTEIAVKRGEDSPAFIRETILEGIRDHFRKELGRPELLNRIGENIVVFDFVDEETAREILDRLLDNIFARVARTQGLRLELAPAAKEYLFEACITRLDDGGRGIGNMLEMALVNPLARALFETNPRGSRALIAEIRADAGKYSVRLEC
ncbi:MAG: AAA family ATPase [Pseudomonadota bacterium]